MNQAHIFETHASNLGRLVGNLQMIEMGARIAIAKRDAWQAKREMVSLPQVKRGDLVEISPLTDTNDLRNTLERYNKFAPLECRVSVDLIVELRDALAHGRVFGHGPQNSLSSLRLVKFDTDKRDNKVEVKMVVEMTDSWFKENIEFSMNALLRVAKAMDYGTRELSSST